MPVRVRDEEGFGIVELLMAIVVVSVALLALMGSYDAIFASLHSSARTSTASVLANRQLELYGTLSYSKIGLDATTLQATKTSDTVYAADEAALAGATGTDVTITGCGSSAQCLPVQTITGNDHHVYRLETFIRDIPSFTGRTERTVTVIVRDESSAGGPQIVTVTTAFDRGP